MSAAMWIQIIRDLVDVAINDTRARMREEVKARAHKAAEDRVIEALAGKDAREQTREMFRGKLKRGELDDTMIEIEVADAAPAMPMLGHAGDGNADAGACKTCSRPSAAAPAASG
jgi:ATP-dependent HslUV protease ATP-binding subunit HslU